MSLFVEVNSIDKNCKVIINLDEVVEIAPLLEGGCAIFFTDVAGMNSKTAIKVSDDYGMFKQFVLQTVSPDDIKKQVKKINQNFDIPKL